MKVIKSLFSTIIFLMLFFSAFSQIITVTPSSPTVDDTIVLIYDSSLGNGELDSYNGDVYMHTGVITTESTSGSDWKYVKTNWCENTPETLMDSIGENLYQTIFCIRTFYGIPDSVTVLSLAFVFRSDSCNLVGRNADGSDIFYPLNVPNSTYINHNVSNDTLFVECIDGEIIITPYSTNILNVYAHQLGEPNIPSYSTIAQKKNVATDFSIVNSKLKFGTDSVDLFIDTNTLEFSFVYKNDTILKSSRFFDFSEAGLITTVLKPDERIYGLGSRAKESDRRGRVLQIYNQAHYGYSWGTENLNITVPILFSSDNYSLFFDNHSTATIDVGSSSENIKYSYTSGQSDIFFIAGNNYNSMTQNYSFLTGHQPMPPLWALGYIQSKYGYQNQTEAENILSEIRNADFPLDALVLDLYWFGNTSTMGNLDWNYSQFPDPQQMMQDFSNIGVKTILISEPYFTLSCSNYDYADSSHFFSTNSGGETYVLYGFWAGDAALLDIFNPDAQNWFWQFYKNRINEGATAWWTDLGEPETHPSDMFHINGQTANDVHNVYSLEWEKMIYENWQIDFPTKRLFNLSRSGFCGMQRYSTFPWSGDISSSFDGLRAQVPIMLSMGLCGVGYMHSDVGGFVGISHDDELFTRWVQMATFVPVLRIHGSGVETAPIAYSEQTQTITRNYIKLRYRLLPYNYTLAYENSAYGIPLARPMDFYEPQNIQLQNINDQFLWGDNFLIAPVLYSGITQRNVVFPEGKWLNYFTLAEYDGNTQYTVEVNIENIPVYVKSGSFIPNASPMLSTDDYISDTLFIQYFPDEEFPISNYTMYDDNRTSPTSIVDSAFELIHFSGAYNSALTEINIIPEGNGYIGMPATRQLVFEIFRIDSVSGVLIDDVNVAEYNTINSLVSAGSGYYFNFEQLKLYVNVPFSNQPTTVKINDLTLNKKEIPDVSNSVILFPNPGLDYFIARMYDSDSMIRELTVYNVQGKVVYSQIVKGYSQVRVNTETLQTGLYFVEVKSMDGLQVVKWIKK